MTKPNGSVEEEIMSICNKYGFTPTFPDGCSMFFLRTPYSRWRIQYREHTVTKVHHENYWERASQRKKPNKKYGEGFHVQDIKSKSFNGVLKYIQHHDRYYIRSHNTRMDALFAQIEKESHGKKTKIA